MNCKDKWFHRNLQLKFTCFPLVVLHKIVILIMNLPSILIQALHNRLFLIIFSKIHLYDQQVYSNSSRKNKFLP